MDEYEAAFKEGVAAASAVEGLTGRVLSRDLDDPHTGYSASLWSSAQAMEAYEAGEAETEILPRIQLGREVGATGTRAAGNSG